MISSASRRIRAAIRRYATGGGRRETAKRLADAVSSRKGGDSVWSALLSTAR